MKQALTTILTVIVTVAVMSLFGGGVGQPQHVEIPRVIGLQVEQVGEGCAGEYHMIYRGWSDGVIEFAPMQPMEYNDPSTPSPLGGSSGDQFISNLHPLVVDWQIFPAN